MFEDVTKASAVLDAVHIDGTTNSERLSASDGCDTLVSVLRLLLSAILVTKLLDFHAIHVAIYSISMKNATDQHLALVAR